MWFDGATVVWGEINEELWQFDDVVRSQSEVVALQ